MINLKSKTVVETRQFTKDTYKYYYGEGEKPTAGDYHDFDIELMASDQFEVNKPYKADDAGKKYLQIIPIGQSLTYKASNQTESEIPTGWGKLTGKDFSLSPAVNQSVVEKEFSPDYNREFYRLARLYTNNKYDQGQIDEFSIPEITQYKLECWGAASWGADQTTYGGGYSYGNYVATVKNKILYVCAGGEGVRGGYNSKVDIMEEEMLEMAIQEDIGTSITNVEVEMAVEELHISLSKADFLRYLKRPIKVMFFWLLADKEAQPHTLIMIYRYLFIHLVAVK